MEYLSKPEVMEYLQTKRKEEILLGNDGKTLTEVINHFNSLYSFRPTLQSKWMKRGDYITCGRCDFKTLVYKNSRYCPNCGRLMSNGKAYNDKE